MKWLWPIAFVLIIVGAINWGLIGLFDENVIAKIFDNETLLDVIYVAIGVAGAIAVPRMLSEF
jgi:hypothetical protein